MLAASMGAVVTAPAAHLSTLNNASVQPAVAAAPVRQAPRPWAAELQGRPRFHLQPLKRGWINDPNGPHWCPKTKLYHMMYQHFEEGGIWRWGLCWGHAVSKDLLTWHNLPPILRPTLNGLDHDGVWSGCAFPTEEGTIILNTAARLRTSTPLEELPPPELDLGLPVIEAQTWAIANPGTDPLLHKWTKGPEPLLPLPPRGDLTGWRDPFLLGRPGDGLHDAYTMIVGAGIKGTDGSAGVGTALLYQSDKPTTGWTYIGELCRGTGGSNGSMWECPLFASIPTHPDAASYTPSSKGGSHVFVVCPDNAHHAPVYYVGDYKPGSAFDLSQATVPTPLDLGGCTFYAPNMLTNDPMGRLVMWGWCQEIGRPQTESHDYGSCLSVPRLLWRNPQSPHRLWQEPLHSLTELRESDKSWSLSGGERTRLVPNKPIRLPCMQGGSEQLEINVTLEPPSHFVAGRVAKAGLLLRSHPDAEPAPAGSEASGRHGAALLYDWRTSRLELVYSDGTVDIACLARLPASAYRAMNSASMVTVEPGPGAAPPSSPRVSGSAATVEEVEELPGSYGTCGTDQGEEDVIAECNLVDDEDAFAVERRALNVSGCHAVGGRLHLPRDANSPHAAHNPYSHARMTSARHLQPLTLRVFIDHSLVEVFTSTGEVLTSRVYRDFSPAPSAVSAPDAAASIEIASFGVPCAVSGVETHVLKEIWAKAEETAALEAGLSQPVMVPVLDRTPEEVAASAATKVHTASIEEEMCTLSLESIDDEMCGIDSECAANYGSDAAADASSYLSIITSAGETVLVTPPSPRSCGAEAVVSGLVEREAAVLLA